MRFLGKRLGNFPDIENVIIKFNSIVCKKIYFILKKTYTLKIRTSSNYKILIVLYFNSIISNFTFLLIQINNVDYTYVIWSFDSKHYRIYIHTHNIYELIISTILILLSTLFKFLLHYLIKWVNMLV